MDFYFNDVYVKKKLLLRAGQFSLPDNGLFVIQGKNGSGKTLFMNELFHLQIAAGEKCLFIDQSNNRLLTKSSVAENIAFSTDESILKNVRNTLIKIGFEHLEDHNPDVMSGGEKRLTCILRGLQNQQANILFIDEPTNDLDIDVVTSVLDMLVERARKSLIFVVSHDDRISEIADGCFTIADGLLCSDSILIEYDMDTQFDFEVVHKRERFTNRENQLLLKQYRTKFISVLLCFLFSCITIYSGISILNAGKKSIPLMRDDQIDIYIPVSVYGTQMKKSSLPIVYIPLLNGDTEISELVKAIRDDTSEKRNIHFGLNLPESDMYSVYHLEYYDVYNHQNCFAADKYYELTGDELTNTNGLFDLPYAVADEENDFVMQVSALDEAEKFYQTELTSNGNAYELVFCSVVLNEGYTVSDFFQSEEIASLLDGNFYVHCNGTITSLNDAVLFQTLKGTAIMVLLCSLIVFIMEILFAEIYMFLGKNTIRVFRNMAVTANIISKGI